MTHDERDEPETAETADAEASPKKERVLHTRVPAVLEQELKRLAANLRVPVSNVVRAILEDAIEAVDAVGARAEGELHGIAERLSQQRDTLRRATVPEGAAKSAAPAPSACPDASDALAGVIGVEPLTLVGDATCTVCGKTLPRGTRAVRGVRDEPGPRVLLGPECGLVPRPE